jgi:tetratricopeptide (TPR) repeat protein
MFKFSNLFLLGASILVPALAISQSPKKYCEAAQKFEKAGNIDGAIENYSKAIETDPQYGRAYEARAFCYEKANRKPEAVEDYRKAVVFFPKDKVLYYNAGKLLTELGRDKEADEMLRKAIERDKGYMEAIEAEVNVLFRLRDYTNGLIMTQMALDEKRTPMSLYNHAVMLDSTKNLTEAEKFYRYSAKHAEGKFIPGYIGLTATLVRLNKTDEAMKICDEALAKSPENMDVYFEKSKVNAAKKDYQQAINDITRVILARPDAAAYKLRASFYEVLGQHHTAVSDYSQVLKTNDKDIEAYLKRAAANEHIQNFKAALADYNKVAALAGGNAKVDGIVKQAKRKIFELNREGDKPVIDITSMKTDKNVIKVSSDKTELTLKGVVKDASLIKIMNVNSGTATFPSDSLNPEFTLTITDLGKLNEITVSATDVYNNTQISQYKIEKTESDKPIIAIETPIASFENEIFIDNNNPDVYIQGKIKDASLIETIMVDGIIASFNPTHLNPEFSTQAKITDKSKLVVTVRDIYGNENTQEYTLNRSGATAALDNPMGNTWVVFIENSKYEHFPSLEGPAKDVTAMKSALANYKITKTIHKRDMTKLEMEKFFSIELRDYVRNNNVNSLLIWYAGHGKYVSPTGYWVPADGKTDDEFSYFGINNLKASMQSYAGKLVHTLVITDACESGATFLMAMRGGDDEKRCENFELTKAKSSQVFTSAGYELASDNSQFTKTFVSCLNNNVDPCLPIEKIVKKVSVAVSQAGNQAPKFGKIKDLEDEGGTYFFIKK